MIEKSLCDREFCMHLYLTALLDKCNINVVLEKVIIFMIQNFNDLKI